MFATNMTLKEMRHAIKERWREKFPAGCRMLSKGKDCDCTLCLVDNLFIAATAADSGTGDATQFTVCPKCAGELIAEIRCDGRCGKVWEVEELQKLLGETATADAPPEPTEEMVEIGMRAMGYGTPGAPYGGMRSKFTKGLRAVLAAAPKEK